MKLVKRGADNHPDNWQKNMCQWPMGRMQIAMMYAARH